MFLKSKSPCGACGRETLLETFRICAGKIATETFRLQTWAFFFHSGPQKSSVFDATSQPWIHPPPFACYSVSHVFFPLLKWQQKWLLTRVMSRQEVVFWTCVGRHGVDCRCWVRPQGRLQVGRGECRSCQGIVHDWEAWSPVRCCSRKVRGRGGRHAEGLRGWASGRRPVQVQDSGIHCGRWGGMKDGWMDWGRSGRMIEGFWRSRGTYRSASAHPSVWRDSLCVSALSLKPRLMVMVDSVHVQSACWSLKMRCVLLAVWDMRLTLWDPRPVKTALDVASVHVNWPRWKWTSAATVRGVGRNWPAGN